VTKHFDSNLQSIDSAKINEQNPTPKRIRFIKRLILFFLVFLSHIFLSYNYFGGWYGSSIGTLTILIISYFIWEKDFLIRTGLNLNLKQIYNSIIIFAVLAIANLMIIKYIANNNNVLLLADNWRSYYHIIFYTLNEEIVIGALPLLSFTNRKKSATILASIGLALIFSLMHFAFYKWLFSDRGNIEFTTLTTLFFIGIVRNELIIKTGHIGYSWALHCSWIAIMFGTYHYFVGTDYGLTEITRFNTYLGSNEMLLISSLLFVLVLVNWIISTSSKQKYPSE
jgi:hypothetical protein